VKPTRTKLWVVLFLIVVTAIGSYVYIAKNRKPEITYKEHTIRRDDLEISVQATGAIQPENRLVVKPQIAGRVDEILVQEGQKVRAGQLLARMSSNDRAALIDMARSAGSEEQKRWEDIYKPSPVIAPLGGIVISKQVERGQTVGTGDTVFVISDRLIVLAQVDETDLGKISLGQAVEIRVDAYSDQMVTGKVIRIAFESKQVNNVTIYEIRILPDDVPSFMRSGMTTSVKFIQDKKQNVILAPASFLKSKQDAKGGQSGIIKSGDEALTLVKASNPKAPPEERVVTVGATNGKFLEIASGLSEGDIILQPQASNTAEEASSNPFSPMRPPKGRKK
jgi:macrolide-specific efflux system membrane fusion protein